MKCSHVFDNYPDDCDISMIIGEFPSSPEKVLLNLRFHKAVEGAESFGSLFIKYAKDNISVGKGFKEVSLMYHCYLIETNIYNQLNHHLLIYSKGS